MIRDERIPTCSMCMRYIVMWMGTTYGHSCLKWAALYSPSRASIWLTIMGWGIYLEKKTRHSIKRGTYILYIHIYIVSMNVPVRKLSDPLGFHQTQLRSEVCPVDAQCVCGHNGHYIPCEYLHIHTYTQYIQYYHTTTHSVVHVICHTYIQYIHYYHTTTHYLDTVWYMSYIHTYTEV